MLRHRAFQDLFVLFHDAHDDLVFEGGASELILEAIEFYFQVLQSNFEVGVMPGLLDLVFGYQLIQLVHRFVVLVEYGARFDLRYHVEYWGRPFFDWLESLTSSLFRLNIICQVLIEFLWLLLQWNICLHLWRFGSISRRI